MISGTNSCLHYSLHYSLHWCVSDNPPYTPQGVVHTPPLAGWSSAPHPSRPAKETDMANTEATDVLEMEFTEDNVFVVQRYPHRQTKRSRHLDLA